MSKGKTFALVDYDDDSSDDCESVVSSDQNVEKSPSKVSTKCDNINSKPLPVPSSIIKMFGNMYEDNHEDDMKQHSGRTRTFAHERGVWATYIFIKYDYPPLFCNMIMEMLKVTEKYGLSMEMLPDFHVSLSRTQKLRHHWIQPFMDSLKASLANVYSFKLLLQSVEVYANEQNTRTFLGLKVHIGIETLLKIVSKVDLCLKEYNLPPFYEDPSFHVSIMWCLGNAEEKLLKAMPDLQNVFVSSIKKHAECQMIPVMRINCKSGNKLFSIPLKEKS